MIRPVHCGGIHHLAGQNQAGYGGDKGCAARNVTAVGAVAFGAGRTDTVRPAADGHVLNRAKRLLLGIDGLSFPDVPLFQLPAHDPRRRINPGLVDIRHPGRDKALHGVPAQQQLGSGKWIQHPDSPLFVVERFEECLCPVGFRAGKKGFRVVGLLHHRAVFDEQDTVGNGAGEVHLMGDNDHGAARLC